MERRPTDLNGARVAEHDYAREYFQSRARSTTESYLMLGLDPELAPLLEQYITDLHLILKRTKHPNSYVDLQKLPDLGKEHKLVLVVSEQDLASKVNLITELYGELPADEPEVDNKAAAAVVKLATKRAEKEDAENDDYEDDKPKEYRSFFIPDSAPPPIHTSEPMARKNTPEALIKVALDWIFAEQSIVMVSNVYHMKDTIGAYRLNYPGQGGHQRVKYSISAAWFMRREAMLEKGGAKTVQDDLDSLMTGFGLIELNGSLLKHDIVDNSIEADALIYDLRRRFPNAYSVKTIVDRISNLRPNKNIMSGYGVPTLTIQKPNETSEIEPSSPNTDNAS